MSRVGELLRQHGPGGVEHKSLGEVGRFERGSGIQKSDFVDEGVGCIHYGQIHTHYGTWATETKSFISPQLARKGRRARPGDLVIATTSEDDANVGKAVAWLGSDDVAVSTDAFVFRHSLDPKYVSYFFQSKQFHDQKRPHVTGAKVRRIAGSGLAKIRIPVPPMEVQREIVRVLDLFQSLEAELEARRRQYAHYRTSLLAATESDLSTSARWVTLGEIAVFERGTAMTGSAASEGDVPVVANGPEPVYSHHIANRFGETVVVARSGANAGAVSYWDQPIFLTDAFSIRPSAESLTPRFLYQVLVSKQRAIHAMKRGAGVPHIRISHLEGLRIPVPALSEQARIVEILDRFDALVNDLSVGLPAELLARRKQYEYYRDRLLKFEEAA